jgi:hypothetical protein
VPAPGFATASAYDAAAQVVANLLAGNAGKIGEVR